MNVLFIDIDTLRPDHMGCYGYGRNTTPNIDAIAREGVRFDNYYCSDAPCLPSRAALVSGTFGIKNGVVGHGGTAADRFREGITREFRDNRDDWNFHNIFRRAGLYTASVSTFPERHSAWWFQAGFPVSYTHLRAHGTEPKKTGICMCISGIRIRRTGRRNLSEILLKTSLCRITGSILRCLPCINSMWGRTVPTK